MIVTVTTTTHNHPVGRSCPFEGHDLVSVIGPAWHVSVSLQDRWSHERRRAVSLASTAQCDVRLIRYCVRGSCCRTAGDTEPMQSSTVLTSSGVGPHERQTSLLMFVMSPHFQTILDPCALGLDLGFISALLHHSSDEITYSKTAVARLQVQCCVPEEIFAMQKAIRGC